MNNIELLNQAIENNNRLLEPIKGKLVPVKPLYIKAIIDIIVEIGKAETYVDGLFYELPFNMKLHPRTITHDDGFIECDIVDSDYDIKLLYVQTQERLYHSYKNGRLITHRKVILKDIPREHWKLYYDAWVYAGSEHSLVSNLKAHEVNSIYKKLLSMYNAIKQQENGTGRIDKSKDKED